MGVAIVAADSVLVAAGETCVNVDVTCANTTVTFANWVSLAAAAVTAFERAFDPMRNNTAPTINKATAPNTTTTLIEGLVV